MGVIVGFGSGYIFSMPIIDVAFLIATSYFIWSLIKPLYERRKRSFKLQEIAGSPPKHWFYGNFSKSLQNVFGSKWYADITTQFPVMINFWYTFFFSILYVHHPDSAAAYVNSHAPKRANAPLKRLLGDGLLSSSGKKWFRNRRLLTPAFHYSSLKLYTRVFNDCVKIMLRKWEKKVGKNINISGDVSLMTMDIILKCAMSSDINPQENSDHPYSKALKKFSQLFKLKLSTPMYRVDWLFNLTKKGREYCDCINILHNNTQTIIDQRKSELIELNSAKKDNPTTTKDKKFHDFLDMLLLTKDEDGKGLTDLEIRDEVDTFMFAGHDTTSSGIQWAIHNFAKYQDFQEKCRREIKDVIGNKENVEWSDIPKLVYLKMFLKESLRLNPPAYLVTKQLDKPMDIHSTMHAQEHTTISKNTTIALSIYGLHRNPHVWQEPETFDPERFTKENSSKRSTYAYLPFSAGSRNCIGQNFAMNEMEIVLAQTIRRFRFSIESDTPESKTARKITLQSISGVHVYIENV